MLTTERPKSAKESLTARASLGALATYLRVVVAAVLGLLITPIVVGGLGRELYGAWTMLQQFLGYVELADLRATSTIKFTLAVRQHDEDAFYKRRQVGAALAVLWRMAIIIAVLGAIAVWTGPRYIRIGPEHAAELRWAIGIGVAGIFVGQLSSIPGSVLRGVNLEYKAMGLTALASGFASSLGAVAVWSGLGLPALAVAGISGDFITGSVWWRVVKKHVPWFGAARPRREDLRVFWRQTIWISAASFGYVLQNASDLLVVGIILGPAAAAIFGATGAALRMITSSLYSFLGAANPGLAGLCGRGAWPRVEQARNELHLLALIVTVIVGAVVVALNQSFVHLWLGPGFYGGNLLTVLLVVIAFQNIPLRLDTMVMDSMLKFRERAIVTIVTSMLALGLGAVFAESSGLPGMAFGLIIGKTCAIVGYAFTIHVGSNLKTSTYVHWMMRPCAIGASLLASSYYFAFARLSLVGFIGAGALVGTLSLTIMWFVGLGRQQRAALRGRVAVPFAVVSGYLKGVPSPLGSEG